MERKSDDKIEIARLIDELRKQREENLRLRDENRQFRHDVKHMQKKNEKLEAKQAKLQVVIEEIQINQNVMLAANNALESIMETFAPEALYTEFSGIQSTPDRIMWFINYCKRLLIENQKIKKYLFGSGSRHPKNPDQAGETDQNHEAEGQGGTEDRGGAGNQNDVGSQSGDNIKGKATDLQRKVQELLAGGIHDRAKKKALIALGARLVAIANSKDPETELATLIGGRRGDDEELNKNKDRRKSPGKQKNKSQMPSRKWSDIERIFGVRLPKSIKETLEGWICPVCHTVGEYTLSKMVTEMLDSFCAMGLITTDDQGCYRLQAERYEVTCNHCGYSEPAPDENPPMLPGWKLSLTVGTAAMFFYGSGMPVTAFERGFLYEAKLGNDTVLNTLRCMTAFLMPLYNYAGDLIGHSVAVSADETSVNTSVDGVTKRQYICAKSTQPGMWPQAVYFYAPNSRATTNEVIESIKGCRVLTSDHYDTYNKFEAAHQLCLAHLSVKIWEVFEVRSKNGFMHIAENIEKLGDSPEGLKELDLTVEENALLALLAIYWKLACVFSFETAAAAGLGPRDGDKLFANRAKLRAQRSGALMNDVDALFGKLLPHYAEENGKDKQGVPQYKAKDKNNPLCAPVVYWANAHGKFMTFLREPMATADNMALEQHMKFIARIRDASQTLHSEAGGQTLAVIETCMHTARLNGVHNVPRYLFEVAKYTRQQGLREISMAWFQEKSQKLLKDPDAQICKRNFNQPKIYSGVKLPEHLYPHVWAEREENRKKSGAARNPT